MVMANLPYTLTHTDQIRPDQTRADQAGGARRGDKAWTKCWDCRGEFGQHGQVSIRRQQSVHSSWSGCLPARTYTVRIHNNHTEVCPIYSSICLSARRWHAAAADLLVGSSWRWGVKFFTTNCVKIFEAQTSRWVRPTPYRTDVAYGERTKNQFLMTATATTV